MSITIICGDARHIPLADHSVDIIVTSPPYWTLRSYEDGGERYTGQIGSEPTYLEYLEALWGCTAEWVRVLNPNGSIFVVLGDKYATRWSSRCEGSGLHQECGRDSRGARNTTGIPGKSLMMLPERYRIGCVDKLGLVARQGIVWSKTNGMPESVTDRCKRAHEDVVHLTPLPRYYSATDLLREAHQMRPQRRSNGRPADRTPRQGQPKQSWPAAARDEPGVDGHPLGALPGDVWEIAPSPLVVPERISHARCCGGTKRPGCEDGLDHFAAYPPELVRRILAGWCPPAVCLECDQGRFPVTMFTGDRGRELGGGGTYRKMRPAGARDTNLAAAALQFRHLAGWACACTPYTDHPGTGEPARRRPDNPYPDGGHPQGRYGRNQAGQYQHVGPWREYHLEGWEAPPTRKTRVLDPFHGTGTTSMVAHVTGRDGIGVERSADYCFLAGWRTTDPGELARAAGVPKPPPVPDAQPSLIDLAEVST